MAPIVLLSALVGCAAYAILTFAAPAMPGKPAAADNSRPASSRPAAGETAAAELDTRLRRLDAGIKLRSGKVSDLEAEIARDSAEIAARLDGTSIAVLEQRLKDLAKELVSATADRSAAEKRARAAREPERDQSALVLPEAQHAPMLHDLVKQRSRIERQIKEVSAILPPTHPRLRQLNAMLKSLSQQIESESGKLADRFALQAKAAEAEEDGIRQKHADVESRLAAVRPLQAKIDARETELASSRAELSGLQQERREARAQREAYERQAETQRAQEARKAQEARRAWAASVPSPSANVMLATLLGLAMTLFAIALTATQTLLRSSYAVTRPSRAAAALARETPAAPAAASVPPVMPPPLEAPLRAARPDSFSAERATSASIEALAPRLSRARVSNFGHRTLITGENASVEVGNEAVALANALAGGGAQVVLVDWCPSGKGVVAKATDVTGAGMNDLLMGKAGFEAILQRLPDGAAHVIACGSPLAGEPAKVTPDEINLVLDALDETYDHIVIAAGYCEARDLFETILGRFDTGILVREGAGSVAESEAPATTFLGFAVADIDVMAFERAPAPAAAGYGARRQTAEPQQARSA